MKSLNWFTTTYTDIGAAGYADRLPCHIHAEIQVQLKIVLLTLILWGTGKIGHATQKILKGAHVRTITTLF